MIELTEGQRQILASTKETPRTVVDRTTNETYVLVPTAVYERLRRLVQDDDIVFSKRDVALMVEHAMKEYDANDPTLELYQQD
jgi:hypothetical protein